MGHAQEEMKEFTQNQLKTFYQRVAEDIDEIESRDKARQEQLGAEIKRDLQIIVDENVSRVEGLTKDNYKKSLQALIELEKKIDARQIDQLNQVRNDFAKVVAQLDSSQILRELDETFGMKIRNVEQQLRDQERNLQAHFD